MSQTVFDENDFVKHVPKKILDRTRENMEVYNMDLADSFQEATRELAKAGTELWKAWYYDDFRAFVPCICGYYGRACRRMNRKANSFLCRECALAEYIK